MPFDMPWDSSSSTLATELLNENPEELADADLLNRTDLMITSNHYLALENEVIEIYLQRINPDLLVGVQEMLNAILMRSCSVTSQFLLRPGSTSSHSMLSSRRGTEESESFRSSSRNSGSTMLMPYVLERGPRININNKEDIASRETDNLCAELDKFLFTSAKTRANLKAELEETQITIQEVCEAHAKLKAVTEAANPNTGSIPAEKFVRHLDEWLQKADSVLEKLHLHTRTLRSIMARVNHLLKQKEEHGENLHPIDFEQLKIENIQFLEKTDQKNRSLLKMKKVAGQCNLLLSNQKGKVLEQMSELSQIQEMLVAKEAQVKKMETEAALMEGEVQKASLKRGRASELIENYKAPDVMAYVKKKAELHELKQAVRVWSHRKKIQQTTLISCKQLLHKLTVNSLQSPRCAKRVGLSQYISDGK